MTDLIPIPSFVNVPQLETSTLALGGTGGPMNDQAQALLNRTEYLKNSVVSAARMTPKRVASFSAIRALSKTLDSKIVYLDGIGFYGLRDGDGSSVDNGGMMIVAADGGRWEFLSDTYTTNITYREYGAIIDKVGDRLFVGGASLHNGTNVASQPDWLTTFVLSPIIGRHFGFQQTAQFAVLNDSGGNAGNASVFGAQTKNFNAPGNAIGVIGVAVNNNLTQSYTGAWGGYFEAFQMPSAPGPAYGVEFDTMNFRADVTTTPYLQSNFQLNGLQIAAGGEDANVAGQFASTVGINFWNNGQTFNTGINFGKESISGTDGVTGVGNAITFAKGHAMQWHSATGQTSRILGDGSTPSRSIRQRFTDDQVQFRNVADKNVLQLFCAENSVNYLSLRSAIAGGAVQILASGDDANVDFFALPKGTGLFGFGTYTAGAPTNTGYVTMRTPAGQTIQLSGRLVP